MELPRRCPSCGAAPASGTQAFCSYCGARLATEEAPAPPPVPEAPPPLLPAPPPPPQAGAANTQYGSGFPDAFKVVLVTMAVLLLSSTCCCILWPGSYLLELVNWIAGTN